MYLTSTKKYAGRKQRPAAFEANFVGQGGSNKLILKLDNEWLVIHFETGEEVKQLLSQAHIIYANWMRE